MVWPTLYSVTAPTEGLKEGVAVGAAVGPEDGAAEGAGDGATVGPNDGTVEGRDDGAVVGLEDGVFVVRTGLYSQPQLVTRLISTSCHWPVLSTNT